jgi:AcrR family transcriptional regulator
MPTTDQTDTRIAILDMAIPLFAADGYSGVSMRTIAKLVGITPGALYHHYPDKQAIYLAAMERAFVDKSEGIISAVAKPGSSSDRLYAFVESFTNLMASDPVFRALFQRELLDGDETRLKLLADKVFGEAFKVMIELAEEIDPDSDAHMLAISMAGLILFHFEMEPVRQFLPGGKAKHNKVNVIVDHIYGLLSKILIRD